MGPVYSITSVVPFISLVPMGLCRKVLPTWRWLEISTRGLDWWPSSTLFIRTWPTTMWRYWVFKLERVGGEAGVRGDEERVHVGAPSIPLFLFPETLPVVELDQGQVLHLPMQEGYPPVHHMQNCDFCLSDPDLPQLRAEGEAVHGLGLHRLPKGKHVHLLDPHSFFLPGLLLHVHALRLHRKTSAALQAGPEVRDIQHDNLFYLLAEDLDGDLPERYFRVFR